MKFKNSILAAFTLLIGALSLASLAQARSAVPDVALLSLPKDHIEVISESRYLVTRSSKKYKKRHKRKHKKRRNRKSKKGRTIAQIREAAIKSSLSDLKELRPYAKNYTGLKRAVRRYWTLHIRRPSANGLTSTIMRYVKRDSKSLVRSEVYSGAKSGVRKVKKQLKKRKK